MKTLKTASNKITTFDVIQLARKYNLEKEIRQELQAGLTPAEALEEWDIL